VEVVRRRVPDIDAIYLFGSVARGRTRPGSDVDVALLLPPGRKLLPDALLATMAELEGDRAPVEAAYTLNADG